MYCSMATWNYGQTCCQVAGDGTQELASSQSFAGAQTSGIILSLIETAKRHGLDPEKYLNYLLQKLPNEESLNSEALEAYLPWQKEIQKMCK